MNMDENRQAIKRNDKFVQRMKGKELMTTNRTIDKEKFKLNGKSLKFAKLLNSKLFY